MERELAVYRRYLVFTGLIYFGWWFVVDLILPQAFNPFLSRAVVVGVILSVFVLSYVSAWVRRYINCLFVCCVWLLTLHYYYLFYSNAEDLNWVIGCYITVMALNFSLLTKTSLISYSTFVMGLSCLLAYLIPPLRTSVFLPGILTIVIQANIGLLTRLRIIKNVGESNERFQLLFNSTFEGVLVHEEGVIVDVNEALAQMVGRGRAELVGTKVLDILHPSERMLGLEKMKLDEVPPFETKGLMKNDVVIDIEVRAKKLKYGGRFVRLVTVQEITDRKRAEKERVAALSMAESVRVRDEFISIASHELRTPITSMKLQTQVIERDLRKNNSALYTQSRLEEFVALFNRQINRLTELVETMLDVSQVSSGRISLHLKSVDLSQLVRDVVESLKVAGQAIEVVPSKDIFAQADPARIEQVIENLLTNALKYGRGQPIRIELSEEPGFAIIVFQDQGIGIAPEFIHRIFDRFERAISARNISGLGLGLYITRQIVNAHGGFISVKSTLDVGSEFTVRLPSARPTPS